MNKKQQLEGLSLLVQKRNYLCSEVNQGLGKNFPYLDYNSLVSRAVQKRLKKDFIKSLCEKVLGQISQFKLLLNR